MADWPAKKNASFTVTFPIYDADGDLVSGAASLDSEVSKDGGTFTDCTNEAAEIATSSGVYTLALTATEMNADIVATITKTATAGAKTAVNVMYTVTRQLIDLAYPTVSGRSIDVAAGGEVGIDLDNTAGALGTAQFDNDFLTAALIANGAIDAGTFAAGAIDAAALAADAGAEIADAVWDEAMSGHVAAGSFGQRMQGIRSGTAQAGAAGTITLDTGASGTDDFYNDAIVFVTGGTGAGQARLISDYTGSSKVANVVPNWVTNPDATSVFVIIPSARVDLHTWLGSVANALISGRVDSNVQAMANDVITAAVLANGAIDAAAFAAGAVDAAALAADAVAEIADGVWDEAASGHTTAGTFGRRLQIVRDGTAQAGAAGTITLDASASATDDLYNGHVVFILSGTGAGQARRIVDYVGSTKVATITPNWATNPAADSVFLILPDGRASVGAWLDTVPNALQSGRVDSYAGALASGVIAAASFAANAIDAAALAADAANEIADAVLKRDIDQVEATMALHSLGTAILKAVSRIRDNAGTYEVYRTDGTTIHMSQAITTAAGNDPIDELGVGS